MSTTDRVRDLVLPLLDEQQVELYDLELSGNIVKVVVDREGGVDLGVVAEVTRQISRALDEHDPIDGRYTLEVSSPGLERTLRTPEHFARAVGSKVSVKTGPDSGKERRITGMLAAADADGITVAADADADAHHLRYDEIEKARTVFEWGPAPRPTSASDKKKARTS